MRRAPLLFLLPLALFAVQCEDSSDALVFRKADDDLLLDRMTGEWRSRDAEGGVASLTICENRAPAPTATYCRARGCLCHDVKGGGEGRDEEITPAGGCDCSSGDYGAVVNGTLDNSDGESHVLEGRMRAWMSPPGTTRASPYDPPWRIDLAAPPGTHRVAVIAVWDGTMLSVSGMLPPHREPHEAGPGGDGHLPSFAYVDASRGTDRVLSGVEPRSFEKVRSRGEACP